jgi:uncharacterized SAM-binding protein YcdF (DUF218 family)
MLIMRSAATTNGAGRRKFRRIVSRLLWAVIISYFLVATPLAYYYAAPLRVASDPKKSDVIVLLSSGQLDEPFLTTDAAQRTWGALKLFRENYAHAIISSGSQFHVGLQQAERQAEWLQRAGVPQESIIIENRSERTYTSGIEVSNIMRARGWKSAVIVTSQMDVPRVRMVFAKLGVAASFLAVPEFHGPEGLIYFPTGYSVFYHATYEYAGLLLYKWRGWI